MLNHLHYFGFVNQDGRLVDKLFLQIALWRHCRLSKCSRRLFHHSFQAWGHHIGSKACWRFDNVSSLCSRSCCRIIDDSCFDRFDSCSKFDLLLKLFVFLLFGRFLLSQKNTITVNVRKRNVRFGKRNVRFEIVRFISFGSYDRSVWDFFYSARLF